MDLSLGSVVASTPGRANADHEYVGSDWDCQLL